MKKWVEEGGGDHEMNGRQDLNVQIKEVEAEIAKFQAEIEK
jgi:hypothetical protein